MSKKPLIVVLAGLSGSGKGTQAEMLVKKFNFEYVVMGDLLREEVKKGTNLGEKIDKIINIKGELVPDHITFQLLKNKLLQIPSRRNIIIDGYPRTSKQVDDLDKILKKLDKINFVVLNIKISDKTAIERLSKRLVCPRCNAIYKEGEARFCSKCNVKLVKRKDDTPERIKKRLAWAHKDLDLVINLYRKRGVLFDIDGERAPDVIHNEIVKILKKYF